MSVITPDQELFVVCEHHAGVSEYSSFTLKFSDMCKAQDFALRAFPQDDNFLDQRAEFDDWLESFDEDAAGLLESLICDWRMANKFNYVEPLVDNGRICVVADDTIFGIGVTKEMAVLAFLELTTPIRYETWYGSK